MGLGGKGRLYHPSSLTSCSSSFPSPLLLLLPLPLSFLQMDARDQVCALVTWALLFLGYLAFVLRYAWQASSAPQ